MENNFKGTQKKVYALQFGSVMFIQDDDYYEANNILDIEDVGEEVVKQNIQVITDAFNIRQQINCDLPELLERYNKAVEELKKSDEEIIKFGLWLTQNCKPSRSKDGWWVFKDIWLTTDECLFIFREGQLKTLE